MKKIISVLLCAVLIAATCIALSACGKEKSGNANDTAADNASDNGGENSADTAADNGGEQTDVLAGGWTRTESPEITEELKKVFDKAMTTLTGVEYVPVAYLGRQIVAGTNHCVLCKATPTVPGASATYSVVYIYEDLNGNAEVTEVAESELPAEYAELDGGWSEAVSPTLTDDAKEALTKACAALTGMEYTPVALLATQVVAGVKYRIVCEATATVPGAESEYIVVEVFADLDGNAEIVGTYEIKAEGSTQIANPVVEYGAKADSLENAEKAVGFTITLPEGLEAENYVVINGTLLEIDFDGGYIRKEAGDGDISGDYNSYEKTETKDLGGKQVTVKGDGDKIMLAIWVDGDYTYCVGISDGASEADMTAYVNSIK